MNIDTQSRSREVIQEDSYQRDGTKILALVLANIMILRKWWNVVAGALFIVLIIGALVAKSAPPPKYLHSTTIEIGRGVDKVFFVGPSIVADKIQQSYLPNISAEHTSEQQTKEAYTVETEIFDDAGLVVLETYGTVTQTGEITKLHGRLVDLITQEHDSIREKTRISLQGEKFRADLAAEALKGKKLFFNNRLKYIDDLEVLLKRQVIDVKRIIDQLEENRAVALRTNSSEFALPATLLLLSEDIQKNREKLAVLEERIIVGLPQQRKEIEKEEFDNDRQMREQARVIEEIQFKVDGIKETTVVSAPARTLKQQAQIGPLQIMALAAGVGLLLGIFIALIMEFSRGMRYTSIASR